ncbi:MAG: hypothetical protein N2111_14145 [Candidatus Sumerlaeaceae bacterium]|nr:hypothetical protein [Candidatus Sumerlaeaceae bacterium]
MRPRPRRHGGFLMGCRHVAGQNLTETSDAFSRAIEADPGCHRSHFSLVYCRLLSDERAEALAGYDRAVALSTGAASGKVRPAL